MASKTSISISKSKLLEAINNEPSEYINVTVNINDEVTQFGHNANLIISQSKEQRENKEKPFYLGNGNTFWTDGKIAVFKKQPKAKKDDLPF